MSEEVGKVVSLDVERGSPVEFSYSEILNTSTFRLGTPPANGEVRVSGKLIKYIPALNFIGNDFFSYIGDDNIKGIVALSIKEFVFKPRARLLIQLGNQLIKNESIALIELAKNSFDADASFCNITMRKVEDPLYGKITIEDDGFGMDLYTVKNAWLEPGSNNKEILVKSKITTPKFGRLPIGEKGIGRFGVHKLGKKIEMITRKEANKEVVVRIDWEEFEKYKYLNEAPVEIFEREPTTFTSDRVGTQITITSLSKSWTRGMIRDVYRALNGISTPPTYDIDGILGIKDTITSKDEFTANLDIDRIEWIEDIPSLAEILEYSLFYFDIEIDGDKIKKFIYKFKPWDRFSGIEGRTVTEKDDPIKDLLDIADPSERKFTSLSTNGLEIGKFQFKGSVFMRDRFMFKLFNIQPASLTDYLDNNGGIRVYRNGIRVYDYGEKENDWLALDYRRFNNPGVKLSNNLILASINLDREQSADLIEKTNREGFIDNETYKVFKKQITYSLKLIELLRLEDKRKIDLKFKSEKDSEPVLKSIEGLRSLVKEKVKDKVVQKQLSVYVDRIEKNYRFMNDTLIKSASAGLGWSIYIHEIEKIISEIIRVLKKDKVSERIMKLAFHLSELIESYAQILRRTTKSNQFLSKIVDQALFNIEYRLAAHGINIVRADLEKGLLQVSIARNLVISNIMNLVDNSIYWLDRSKNKRKTIRFDIADIFEGYISLVISDNGTGFSLSPLQMVEPFVSAKPGGMGLGLHIISEVMASHNGLLSFNEKGDLEVPKEFRDGATVIMSFKR
jgi:signal transduction histidine kinase